LLKNRIIVIVKFISKGETKRGAEASDSKALVSLD